MVNADERLQRDRVCFVKSCFDAESNCNDKRSDKETQHNIFSQVDLPPIFKRLDNAHPRCHTCKPNLELAHNPRKITRAMTAAVFSVAPLGKLHTPETDIICRNPYTIFDKIRQDFSEK